MKSGKKIFRPRARIIKSLGDELISNEFVAISELVKNSYDARASFVKIDIQENKIIIADNGKGMALDELQEGWFEPATNIKFKNNKVLGEKGIGRFSVVKLASRLKMNTKSIDQNSLEVSFDWESFNKENSYLDEIEVEWNECSWEAESETGTTLELIDLKDDWGDANRIKKLEIFLSRMISPFDEVDKFKIYLKNTESDFQKIEASEILKHPHYLVSGEVKNKNISINYQGLNNRIKNKDILIENTQNLFKEIEYCGDFKFEFRIWDRDIEKMKFLGDKYDLTLREVKNFIDDATGVSVYRDGFRVLPYGEPNNDWLRLDMRRVQSPSLRLSNNQILGYIRISKKENPELNDKTNREGLIENLQYENFYNKIRNSILVFIEVERHLDRTPKREEITKKRTGSTNFLETQKLIEEVSADIKKDYPQNKKLIQKTENIKLKTKEQGEKFKKIILRYRRLSTLGQLLETVIHEINNSFAGISCPLSTAINYAGDNKKVIEKINLGKKRLLLLQKFIDRLRPFAERKTDRSSVLNLKNEIKNVIEIEKTRLDDDNISISFKGDNANFLMKKVDIFSVISNLIDNSNYWLTTVNQERKISIQLKESNKLITILFSDNGPGIEEEYQPYIFDPYFSKKIDGTGLGLSIIGEIISDYDGTFEYYKDGDLDGAAFKITFKK